MRQKLAFSIVCRFLLASATFLFALTRAGADDRTTCFVPLASHSPGGDAFAGVTADQAYGNDAGDGWQAYIRVWRAHHEDPSDVNIRRFLGLPLRGVLDAEPKRSRSAPPWLGWRAGSYQQVETPHFSIFTHAPTDIVEMGCRGS